MTLINPGKPVSRRAALVGMSALGAGAALGGTAAASATQTLTTANHPLTGVWMAMANPTRRGVDPQFPGASLFGADGTVILGFLPAEIGMSGDIQYVGQPMGVWEPYDEQTGHFTVVQGIVDKIGKLTGSVTIDGHPTVKPDGTLFDDGSLVTVTIRDPSGAIVAVVPPGPSEFPVTAIKMQVGKPGFPNDDPAGTPTP